MSLITGIRNDITAVAAIPTTNYYEKLTLVQKISAFVAQIFCDVTHYSESGINKREAEKALSGQINGLKNRIANLEEDENIKIRDSLRFKICNLLHKEKKVNNQYETQINVALHMLGFIGIEKEASVEKINEAYNRAGLALQNIIDRAESKGENSNIAKTAASLLELLRDTRLMVKNY